MKPNGKKKLRKFLMARAGKDLEQEQRLQAGTLLTLEANVEQEVLAEPELIILVTKFKET